jgi:GT2 family glycosyltransferase
MDGPGQFWIEDLRIRQLNAPAVLLEIAQRALRQLTVDPVRLGAWSGIAWRIWRSGNLNSLKIFVARWLERSELDYRTWVAYHDTLTDEDRTAIRARIVALRRRIRFSIVIRAVDTPEETLRACLDSVLHQIYSDWDVCIVDAASSTSHVRAVLEEYGRRDRRIRVATPSEGNGLAVARNDALPLATGEYLILLSPEGVLSEHACYLIAEALDEDPDLDLVYADEDEVDPSGMRALPRFKGDWDAERFLQQNYFGQLFVLRAALMRRVGGFRPGCEGSQDYDLALRCAAETAAKRVGHVPFVLHHARSRPVTAVSGAAAVAQDAALRAVADHLRATGTGATVERGPVSSVLRIRYPLPEPAPRVTLIIPTRNGAKLVRQCVDSIVARTSYPSYEILLVDNESDESSSTAYFRELESSGKVRLLCFEGPFNYAAINNLAARHASGDILGLLNNDTEVINGEWLSEMASHASRPGIGAVGARLLYPDGTIQHAGVVMGLHGTVGHLQQRMDGESRGYCDSLVVAREVTAVTGACLLVRRSVYEEVGGLDQDHLAVAFNDIDFCLKLRRRGYRNIWTPYALLYHHEAATRGPDDSPEKAARFSAEWAHMKATWGSQLEDDPYYSPNLSLACDDCSPSFPPRCEVPWSRHAGQQARETEAAPCPVISPARIGR